MRRPNHRPAQLFALVGVLTGACTEPRAEASLPETSLVTYEEGAKQVFAKNCVVCHRSGGIGPFALTTYQEARPHGAMIEQMVGQHRMPPWFANPEYGTWRNDRRLSEEDRRTLLAWVASGTPEGTTATDAEAIDPPVMPASRWALGREADAVVPIPEPMEVPAEGVLPYQYVFVKTDFAEDRWLQGIELHPTALEVTHHVAAFLQGPDDFQRGPYLTLWTGRTQPTIYPTGIAKRLPAGAWIMFELHYAPKGQPMLDRTELGLIFADTPPDHEAATLAVATREFEIPPFAENHPVVAEMTFWRGGTILSLLPHMHRRGKAFRYELERSDGSVEILLDIPRYDHRWQLTYEFATPLRVEAGDVLRARAWYDNSANNPWNPDPSAAVAHGPQDFEEMMAGFFEWIGDRLDVNVAPVQDLRPSDVGRIR